MAETKRRRRPSTFVAVKTAKAKTRAKRRQHVTVPPAPRRKVLPRVPDSEPQQVIGCIGTSPDIVEALTSILHDYGTNWTQLAQPLGVTRQALLSALRRPRVDIGHLRIVCDAIGVDPFAVFNRVDVRAENKREFS